MRSILVNGALSTPCSLVATWLPFIDPSTFSSVVGAFLFSSLRHDLWMPFVAAERSIEPLNHHPLPPAFLCSFSLLASFEWHHVDCVWLDPCRKSEMETNNFQSKDKRRRMYG